MGGSCKVVHTNNKQKNFAKYFLVTPKESTELFSHRDWNITVAQAASFTVHVKLMWSGTPFHQCSELYGCWR